MKADGTQIAPSDISAGDNWRTVSPGGFTKLLSLTIADDGFGDLIDTIKVRERPDLTPIPLPASAGLIAVALACTAALARRKRRAA